MYRTTYYYGVVCHTVSAEGTPVRQSKGLRPKSMPSPVQSQALARIVLNSHNTTKQITLTVVAGSNKDGYDLFSFIYSYIYIIQELYPAKSICLPTIIIQSMAPNTSSLFIYFYCTWWLVNELSRQKQFLL